MIARQRGHGLRDQRADDRRKRGDTHPSGGESDVRVQFGVGGVDPPDDLGRPLGQQLPGRCEPDAAPDPLQQLRAGLRLEPGEVVADRRLGVVHLPGRGGNRAQSRERVEDAQPSDVQHSSSVSMDRRDKTH